MANINQETPQSGGFSHAGPQQCTQCEGMLADALDGTLATDERVQFDLHIATCVACAQMLADAQSGAAWLELLRTPRPEPPAALLERILAQTSGQAHAPRSAMLAAASGAGAVPSDTVPRMATVIPFRSRVTAALRSNAVAHALLQPRLAMTAAMAFFSIGLTLNLTGVRLNELRVANLKPSNLRRSFYQADAHLVRYYTNLRVVYELESRVRDLQRANENDTPSGDQEKKPDDSPSGSEDKPARPPGAGTSRRSQRERNAWSLASLTLKHPNASRFYSTHKTRKGEFV